MKSRLYLFIILIFTKGFSQEAEQIALDFYAKNYAAENKNDRIRYDGKITNYGNEYAKNVVLNFFDCQVDEDLKDPRKASFHQLELVYEKLKSEEIKFEIVQGNLKVPKEIIFLKKLRQSSIYRNFINYNLNKFWYWIFPEKYNLTVYPAVKFENFVFVEIHTDKKDGEHGRLFYVKMSEDLKIIDSCQSGWIQ